jgi:hypothetical protein
VAVADHVVRIGWFASMTKASLIAITDADDQIDVPIVPQTCPRKRPTGLWRRRLILPISTTPDLLRAAGPATRGGPTRIARADVAEAAWDNEGGARPAANLSDD